MDLASYTALAPEHRSHGKGSVAAASHSCSRHHVSHLGIEEVLATPRSPWQRAYVERVIGSIRRECLDHVIVFHESSLRRILVPILTTTTDPERICPWKRTRLSHARFCRPESGQSWRSPR